MRAWRSLLAVAAIVFASFTGIAQAQGLNTLSSDGFAPMSLMPDAAAIPSAGSFRMVAPEPSASNTDLSGIAAPSAPTVRTLSAKPSAIAVAPEAVAESAPAAVPSRVPMPPRRPFNLGFDKKQKPLLAKLLPEESPRQSSMTRSLVAMEDLPGVRIRSDKLIQQASLSNTGVQSDASPDASAFVGEGRVGGGILKQTPSVQTGCLQPDLLAILRKAGRRFGGAVVITSGYRDGGRRGSYHRKCMAADIKIDGVPKETLAAYFRSLPEAGGVGLYCHNGVVHIDTAEPRNWTYCGFVRTSFSLRGGGWGGNVHVRKGQALPDNGDSGE
jgi:Peptidase M15